MAEQQPTTGHGEDESPTAQLASASPVDRAFLTNDTEAGQLILVRHGQQIWPDPITSTNGEWVDPPLSELGLRQAATVAGYLATEPITAVYSSNLQRARVTGQIIADQHGLEVEVVEQLAEFHFYGLLPHDSRARDVLGQKIIDGARERFALTRRWDSFPESESSAEFRRRVGYAVEAAVTSHPSETIVVACHGGVINAYLAEILGIGEDMFFRASHASVHRIRYHHGRRVLESVNEDAFLRQAGVLTR